MPKSKNDIVRESSNPGEVLMKFQREYNRAPTDSEGRELDRLWGQKTSSPSSGSGSSSGGGLTTSGDEEKGIISKVTGWVNDKIKGFAGITEEMIGTQLSQVNTRNFNVAQDLLGVIAKQGISTKTAAQIANLAYVKVNEQLREETELLEKINQKTSLTGELSESLRNDMENASIYAAKFGMSVSDIGDMYVNLVAESGKLTMINRGLMEQALPLSRAFDISMSDLGKTIATFSDVGITAENTIKSLTEAGVKSTSLGLSGKKIISDIQANIGKLNEYGFKNGIEGLTRMAQKANQFKVTMEMTSKLAEKVFEPEGALELVANMQMLGGAVGDLNDPLKLMYMATNNFEGLQDAIIGASKGLATYNREQRRFEISGANLRIAREQAKALGLNWDEYNKTIIKTAERQEAMNALMGRGLEMKPEDREFITNLSTMEGGQMVIKLPEDIANKIGAPANVAIKDLSESQKDLLIKNKDMIEKMSAENMAERQLTQLGQINQNTAAMGKYFQIRGARTVKGAAEGFFGSTTEKLNENIKNKVTIRRGKIGTVEDQKTVKEQVEKFKEHPFDYTTNAIKTMYGKIKDEGVSSLTKNEYTDAFYMALVKYNYDFKKTVESFNGSGGHSDYLKKK